MKAVTIIDLLTRDSREGMGVLTIDEYGGDTYEDLIGFFGDGLESVYDPNDIFHLKVHEGEKPRSFIYMYDERFDIKYDKELFAVLSLTDGTEITSLVYLYEIE